METPIMMKRTPKDAELRIQTKQQLIERMKTSLEQQGSFGIIQTGRWLAAYKKAQRAARREMPTVRASTACIKALKDACENFQIPA